MARAAEIWYPKLLKARVPFAPVNFVHDEFQIETERDLDLALFIASTVADAICEAGVDLKLLCPMAGSILADHGMILPDGRKVAVGDNWYVTH
jgi:hypothetical protein